MMSVLISGASGFVGTHLTTFLQSKNLNIIPLSRKPNKDLVTYETLTSEYLDRFDTFIHLAGKAHDLKGSAEEDEYFKVNTDLTKLFFKSFLQSSCKHFIFLSSVKAVADSLDNTLTEEEEPNPKTPYGKSKLAAEKFIKEQHISDKKVYILRPCMIHGANNKGNLNLLYKIISKGIPYPLGSFHNARSFVHIDNLSYIIYELLSQQPLSNTFNVADDHPISTRDVVLCIGNVTGKKVIIMNTPKFIINIFSKMGDLLHLPFDSQKIEKLTENYIVSNEKVKQTLIINKDFNTKEGLIKTIKSFK